jgi:F0F1-type ATP synthase assembly protein I
MVSIEMVDSGHFARNLLQEVRSICYSALEMTNAANTKKTTSGDDLEKQLKILQAKQQFLGATMGMGWRLAVTVVVPIVLGVKLDEHFKSSPSLTLAGLFLAAGAGSMAVWSTIKEVNEAQAEAEADKTSKEDS